VAYLFQWFDQRVRKAFDGAYNLMDQIRDRYGSDYGSSFWWWASCVVATTVWTLDGIYNLVARRFIPLDEWIRGVRRASVSHEKQQHGLDGEQEAVSNEEIAAVSDEQRPAHPDEEQRSDLYDEQEEWKQED
jgi:hypothetical protein